MPQCKEILRIGALCLVLLAPAAAPAQEGSTTGAHVSIELNAVEAGDDACTLTFLVINGHDRPIAKAIYETVLFDGNGRVDRLTLFDFGTLPAGRPRVRQFSVPGMRCGNLSQVLINGAHACEAPGLAADACEAGLQVSTRTDVEMAG